MTIKEAYSRLALACWLPNNLKKPSELAVMCLTPGARKGPHKGHVSCALGHQLPYAFGAAGAAAIQSVIPPLHPVFTGADPRALRQPQDQTPVGGPHAGVGIKPKLNPRDGVTKEDRKSFHQLYKLQINAVYGISE